MEDLALMLRSAVPIDDIDQLMMDPTTSTHIMLDEYMQFPLEQNLAQLTKIR